MGKVSFVMKYSIDLGSAPSAVAEPSFANLYDKPAAPTVVIDVERMKVALASESHELPTGLGRAERRKRILAVANRQK